MRKQVNFSSIFFFLYSAVTRIFFVPLIVIARNSWNLFSPSVIANCFRRADFVTPTHFEEVVESEYVSSFKTDLEVDCTFEEYMCSNSQLQCSPVLSSADTVASLGEITEMQKTG